MSKIKSLNFKKIIKAGTVVWGLILIVIMTVSNVIIDPEKLNFYSWASNTLIICGIMIFGLLMGESIGVDKQVENVNGLYQRNLKEYNERNKEIEGIVIYFSQFFLWFKKKELYEKKVEYLINHDVDGEMVENIVKYVRIDDLFELSQHAICLKDKNGNDIFIEKQGEEQIEAIKNVLQGKIKVDCPNTSYFLNAFENSKSVSVLEVGKQIDKEIAINKHFNRIFKIGISVVVSLIFSMLTVNDFMGHGTAQEQLNAWFNLISRLTALATSLLSGWLSGSQEVKLRAKKVKNKYIVLTLFKNAFESKEFIPASANELAKKNYESYLEEKQKAIDNVITPEVIKQIELK